MQHRGIKLYNKRNIDVNTGVLKVHYKKYPYSAFFQDAFYRGIKLYNKRNLDVNTGVLKIHYKKYPYSAFFQDAFYNLYNNY